VLNACKIYAAFVLIKILSLQINSEGDENGVRKGQRNETKHVRINLKKGRSQ